MFFDSTFAFVQAGCPLSVGDGLGFPAVPKPCSLAISRCHLEALLLFEAGAGDPWGQLPPPGGPGSSCEQGFSLPTSLLAPRATCARRLGKPALCSAALSAAALKQQLFLQQSSIFVTLISRVCFTGAGLAHPGPRREQGGERPRACSRGLRAGSTAEEDGVFQIKQPGGIR